MLRKYFGYTLLLACGVLALASLPASADDKKDEKPALSGAWGKKDGELKIEFSEKDVMKIAPHGDLAQIGIVCQYTVDKEGRVKAKVTGFEGKEELKKKIQEHFPVGFKFNFEWKVKGDDARIEDVKGDDVAMLKSHLEGDFAQKK